MDIFEKIDQIREKPEHVRIFYVWFFVVIFMIFVVFVWFISLKSSLRNSTKSLQEENKMDIMEEIKNSSNINTGLPGSDSNAKNDAMQPANNSAGRNDLKSLNNQ